MIGKAIIDFRSVSERKEREKKTPSSRITSKKSYTRRRPFLVDQASIRQLIKNIENPTIHPIITTTHLSKDQRSQFEQQS